MKRSTWNVGGWIAGIFAVAVSAAPASAEGDTWYAQRVTQSAGGVAVEHLWSKGASVRDFIVGHVAERDEGKKAGAT